ncbi:Proteasomal ATPase-associated factor 1 [Paragonimus heterotremus]|uniref:Proteasomal ATPase-associated factor 1 n=1 Tax=Paragonimus heterotremus TaxID=100268 RepID=A0A8J4WNQ7_9TREM|nr:Proteasomal ATPase-associated factor 1 [Paragonimus heterotremus]
MAVHCTGFRLQPNWDKAYSEGDSHVWFHKYVDGSTHYHKLLLQDKMLVPDTDSVDCKLISPTVLKLTSISSAVRKYFQSPDLTIASKYSEGRQVCALRLCLVPQPLAHLSCMDIGPSGELALSASSDKVVHLWEASTGRCRRTLEGHLAEVYSCRFFPSGLAALTAGADMQLKIWCLLTGQCAATLAPGTAGARTGTGTLDDGEPGGHRTGIVDTGIVDRGRNILAIDRLGWLRLWDVSTQVCISGIPLVPSACTCRNTVCPVLEHACSLAVKKQHQLPLQVNDVVDDQSSWYHVLETSSTQSTEVGTSNAVVAVGMGSGAAVQLYELAARKKGHVARFTLPHTTGSIEACVFPKPMSHSAENDNPLVVSDLDTCAFVEYGLYAGGQTGELVSFDLRYPREPLIKLTSEKGAVHQLQAYVTKGGRQVLLLVGRSDGRVVVYSYDPALGSGSQSRLTKLEDSCQFTHCTLELTGINCEPVRGLAALPRKEGKQLGVWTASLSGVFRYYQSLATDVAFG